MGGHRKAAGLRAPGWGPGVAGHALASVLSVLRAGGARPSAVGAADLLCGGRDPGCRHSGMWVGKNQELRPYEGL